MDLNRIDCQYVDIGVTATLRDGTPADLEGVDVALLPPRRTPDGDTVWTTSSYVAGKATVLLAGPDVVGVPEAITIPTGGADLWIRVADAPEVDAARIARISVV